MTSVDKVRQRLAKELQPDERVLYSAFGLRTGGVRKAMIGGALGIAGAAGAVAMAAATTQNRAEVPATAVTLPARFFVGVTNQRLLVFSSGGAIVAKPKDILHSYAFDRIAWVSDELVEGVAMAYRVSVGVADVGVLNFEFPRLQVPDARPMVTRIKHEMPAATT